MDTTVTSKQLRVLRALVEQPLYINEDVPKPYAYLGDRGDMDVVSMRTARSLVKHSLIEKVPTKSVKGSFKFCLSAEGHKVLCHNCETT